METVTLSCQKERSKKMKIENGCVIVMKAFGGYERYTNDTRVVYDWISSNFDDLEAIRASSWCELATVGETYQGNGFTLEICLDD